MLEAIYSSIHIMTPSEFFLLFTFAAFAWLVWDNLKAREAAVVASRRLCKSEGVQLLDDTVAMQSLRPVRDDRGGLRLRRTYAFEYSDTGNNRQTGAVTLVGDRVTSLYMHPKPVPEGESLH